MNHDHIPPQVSLEQLLRVKRAERPAPEFWQQFERELRVKQLAAIVEPRPWWAPFIRLSTRVARYQLPVGATAILALTFLTVREYRLPETDTAYAPTVVQTKVDTMPGPAVTAPVSAKSEPVVATAQPSPTTLVEKVGSSREMASATSSAGSTSPVQVTGMVAMLGGGNGLTSAQADDSPAARAIAANLAAVRARAPELVQMMEQVSGVMNIINPPEHRQVDEPLTRVQAPTENRRTARLISTALPTARFASGEVGDPVSMDRINRRLTEERLYDSVSRFGVEGDRVAFKF